MDSSLYSRLAFNGLMGPVMKVRCRLYRRWLNGPSAEFRFPIWKYSGPALASAAECSKA